MSTKAKPTGPARQLADCGPGDVAQTPAGFLLVTGNLNGWPLCRLWHPDEQRELSHPFGAPPDLAVLNVSPKPTRPRPRAGAPSRSSPWIGDAMHPSVTHVLQFFTYCHLPPNLQEVSAPFHDLAYLVAQQSSDTETTVALRKLLEAKDEAFGPSWPRET